MPENFTGRCAVMSRTSMLLVDAAHMGAEPEQFVGLIEATMTGFSASSHTGPLSSLAQFISVTMDCEVWIIGIEPADLTMNAPLSVSEACVDQVAAEHNECSATDYLETAADHRVRRLRANKITR